MSAPAIATGRQWPEDLDRLLHALPEWFGIEQSIAEYVAAARALPTVAALLDGAVVGLCVVRRHNDATAEIEVLAVDRTRQRTGIGRALLDAVERDARTDRVRLLEVKTRGPSGRSPEYERTRAFYEAVGFLPLEERTDIWGSENPCLIMVKPL